MKNNVDAEARNLRIMNRHRGKSKRQAHYEDHESNHMTLNVTSIQTRLGLCAAALAGTASAVPTAEAAIITFNTPISIPQTTAGVYHNFLTGATSGGATPGWDFNPYNTASGLGFYWNTPRPGSHAGVATTATSNIYADLSLGTVVGPSSFFTANIQGTNPTYRTAGTHILGFRFLNESTGVVNYGYATIQTSGGTGFPATIQSWSFENTGGSITVVPEPSTTALLSVVALALGAVGLRKWRRQNAA